MDFLFYHLSTLRILGVLQRISIVFLVCSFLNRYTSRSFQFILILVLLVGYWVLICFTKPPGMYTLNPEPQLIYQPGWMDIFKNHVDTNQNHGIRRCVLKHVTCYCIRINRVLTASSLQQVREKREAYTNYRIIGILLILLGICLE